MGPGGRARVAVVVAACALSLIPTGASAPASARLVQSGPRDAIQALLDRRANAFLEGDRAGFMATVAPLSRSFVARQRRLFDNAAPLDFSSYRLVASWDRLGDLVTPAIRSRYPSADAVALPLVEERYRLAGFDPRPAAEDMYYTFVELDGEWLVAEDSDLDHVGLYSARHLWDFGPVAVTPGDHFALLELDCGGGQVCAPVPDDLLGLAESALARVKRYWGPEWDEDVPIVVPANLRQLARMIQATYDVEAFVAFAYATVSGEARPRFTGDRILLNWQQFQDRSPESVEVVLAHELLHVATRPYASPSMPLFVEEGIADYVGRDADPNALAFLETQIAAGNFDGRLPENYEFLTGSPTDIFTSYQEGHAAVRFFIERWGLKAFTRFYRRLGSARVAPGTTDHHLDRALRQTIGIGLQRFEREWADSILR